MADDKSDDTSTHDSGHEREPSYLVAQPGIKSWLFTVDHKRLGLMYLGSTLLFFFIAGMSAILFRTELLTPEGDYIRQGLEAVRRQRHRELNGKLIFNCGAVVIGHRKEKGFAD